MLPMEGLRGVAVSLVFLQHFSVQAQLIGITDPAIAFFARTFRAYGNLGVELFFILSGYLIYGTLVRRHPAFPAFMARRAERLYPAFLVVFAANLAFELLRPASEKLPATIAGALPVIAANLVFLPGLVPIPPIVTVAWSLSYEVFFYLAMSAAVLGLRLYAWSRVGRLVFICVLLSAFLATWFVDPPYFPHRMLPFFAGMLLAEGVGGRVPTWVGWAAPLACFAVYAARLLPADPADVLQTLGFFALCAVAFRSAGRVSRALSWPPLRWLGNMSYSYYLVHGPVVRVAMIAVSALVPGPLSPAGFAVGMVLTFAAAIAASAILFILVERPFSLTHRPARAG